MCIWKIQILENETTKGSCLQEVDFRCDFLSFETTQPEQIQLMCVTWTGDTIAVGCCKALTSVPESTLRTRRPGPTLQLLAKKEGLYLFWFKLVKMYSRDQANFFLSSRKTWFGMLLNFAQTFCGFLFMVISDKLFGYPCILAVSSLLVEIMTSETLFLNIQLCASEL